MGAWNLRADALQLGQYTQTGDSWNIPMMAPIRTIPGVILVDASHRNGSGKGAIRSELDGRTLRWRAPGSATFGRGVRIVADSDVLLEDGEDPGKYVRGRVRTAHLRPQPTEQAVYLQHLWNLLFGDFSAAEASAGVTQTPPNVALVNRSPQKITNVRGWISPQSPYLEISADGAAWSKPITEASAVQFGSIDAGWSVPFHARVIIPPATAFNPKAPALLHFRFDGV